MTQNIFRIMKNYFSVITGSRDKCFHVRSIIYTRAHTHTRTRTNTRPWRLQTLSSSADLSYDSSCWWREVKKKPQQQLKQLNKYRNQSLRRRDRWTESPGRCHSPFYSDGRETNSVAALRCLLMIVSCFFTAEMSHLSHAAIGERKACSRAQRRSGTPGTWTRNLEPGFHCLCDFTASPQWVWWMSTCEVNLTVSDAAFVDCS